MNSFDLQGIWAQVAQDNPYKIKNPNIVIKAYRQKSIIEPFKRAIVCIDTTKFHRLEEAHQLTEAQSVLMSVIEDYAREKKAVVHQCYILIPAYYIERCYRQARERRYKDQYLYKTDCWKDIEPLLCTNPSQDTLHVISLFKRILSYKKNNK